MNDSPLGTDPQPAAGCPAPSPEGPGAMHGPILRRKLVIISPAGFHMRPLAAFAETALRFQSRVTVTKDTLGVDGKSPLALMGLAAEQGTSLLIEVSGPDAQAALDALLNVLASLEVATEAADPLTPGP